MQSPPHNDTLYPAEAFITLTLSWRYSLSQQLQLSTEEYKRLISTGPAMFPLLQQREEKLSVEALKKKKSLRPTLLVVPVELFLQQVQACVQLVALLSAQAVQWRVEGRRGGKAAAGNLLVLTTPPALSPETKDVGHT